MVQIKDTPDCYNAIMIHLKTVYRYYSNLNFGGWAVLFISTFTDQNLSTATINSHPRPTN